MIMNSSMRWEIILMEFLSVTTCIARPKDFFFQLVALNLNDSGGKYASKVTT